MPNQIDLHERSGEPSARREVMREYQRVMQRFLAVQGELSTQALQGKRRLPQRQLSGPIDSPIAATTTTRETVPRYVIRPTPSKPPMGVPQIRAGDLFVVTDDGCGVAAEVTAILRQYGAEVLLASDDAAGQWRVDFSDMNAVDELAGTIGKQFKQLAGVLHLAPLNTSSALATMNFDQWNAWLSRSVASTYLLARQLSPSLNKRKGPAWFLSASWLSDRQSVPENCVGQSGSAGLVKTLAQEWPGVSCRMLHLARETSTQAIATQLLSEMAIGDSPIEACYAGDQRFVRAVHRAPLPTQSSQIELDANDVIVITGGASGITGQVALTLAETYQPKLVLVGRTPLAKEAEPAETAELQTREAIQKAIIDRMRESGQRVTPAQVATQVSKIWKQRQIQHQLAVIAQTGADVEYRAVDVRSESDFAELLASVRQSYGRLDGIIHGAGLIEDKLIENKSPESFQRVFRTKTDSAFILCRHADLNSLKFLVFFSSVAGAFGNRGQGDYAAANEVLNDMAIYLDQHFPTKVHAINWGPWDGSGMVSDETKRQFAERGIEVIDPSTGCQRCVEEILFADKGEAVVAYGEGPWKT